MRALVRTFSFTAMLAALCVPVFCQATAAVPANVPAQIAAPLQPVPDTPAGIVQDSVAAPANSPAVRALLAFKDSDVKFSVDRLMDILADKRHEGWVLAAYPDPKTGQPLIGAGFSLDLPAREHPQLDPLNPSPFYEPSSAELWQAAGLAPSQLTTILDQFHEQLAAQSARDFRRGIRDLPPQITDADARQLLRIGIVQSILNARAYCRRFNALTAPQQMAVTQLVYQMGVNLEEFSQFLALMNHDAARLGSDAKPAIREAVLRTTPATGTAYWRSVQLSLARSQWARLYRSRAIAVIAMLDPRYAANPTLAERRVGAVLHPVRHRGRHRAAHTERVASHSNRHRGGHRRRSRHSQRQIAEIPATGPDSDASILAQG
jgi:hypothetical protein